MQTLTEAELTESTFEEECLQREGTARRRVVEKVQVPVVCERYYPLGLLDPSLG